MAESRVIHFPTRFSAKAKRRYEVFSLSLRDLHCAIALVSEQHFSRAAVACGISQSSLSNHIGRVERVLRSQLCERTNGHFTRVTPAANKFCEHAKLILDTAARMGALPRLALASRDLNFLELRSLIAVAVKGNYKEAAAAESHLNKNTLRTQICKIEKVLGLQLFEKINLRMVPTVPGREVINQACVVLKHVADLKPFTEASSGDATCRAVLNLIVAWEQIPAMTPDQYRAQVLPPKKQRVMMPPGNAVQVRVSKDRAGNFVMMVPQDFLNKAGFEIGTRVRMDRAGEQLILQPVRVQQRSLLRRSQKYLQRDISSARLPIFAVVQSRNIKFEPNGSGPKEWSRLAYIGSTPLAPVTKEAEIDQLLSTTEYSSLIHEINQRRWGQKLFYHALTLPMAGADNLQRWINRTQHDLERLFGPIVALVATQQLEHEDTRLLITFFKIGPLSPLTPPLKVGSVWRKFVNFQRQGFNAAAEHSISIDVSTAIQKAISESATSHEPLAFEVHKRRASQTTFYQAVSWPLPHWWELQKRINYTQYELEQLFGPAVLLVSIELRKDDSSGALLLKAFFKIGPISPVFSFSPAGPMLPTSNE